MKAVLLSPVLRIALAFALLPAVPAAAQDGSSFEPRSDYHYDFSASTEPVIVDLDDSGFVWPAGMGDTVFLEIRLVGARGDEPAVRASAGGRAIVQFFEKGARGLRFFDLSRLAAVLEPGARVEMVAAGATWAAGEARLRFFANPPLKSRRVLVVAPHPDDAEIAAFGVYSQATADVVTVTAGDAGGRNFETLVREDGEHYRLKGWIRTWDSITVPFFGGVEPGRARNLGYYDATLGNLYERRPDAVPPPLARLDSPGYFRLLNVDPTLKARPFSSTWPSLVADLRAELERVQPKTVVAPHPLLDRHRDHQFTTIALLEALEAWSGECELYLYTNHAVMNESFPLGPRQGMTGLPPWSGGDLFFDRLYSHQLTEEESDLKLVALEAMHDLRPFDPRDGSVEPPDRKARRRARSYDYFRRGPRPNEIFFVLSRESGARLREAFLGAWELRSKVGG